VVGVSIFLICKFVYIGVTCGLFGCMFANTVFTGCFAAWLIFEACLGVFVGRLWFVVRLVIWICGALVFVFIC